MWASGFWWRGSFEESGTLREDRLKRIDIFLSSFAITQTRKFNPCESSILVAQVPSWDQVAAGGLVIYLRGRRERKVELGRQVKMEVEVLFWSSRERVGSGQS